jgi:hypothetical protein
VLLDSGDNAVTLWSLLSPESHRNVIGTKEVKTSNPASNAFFTLILPSVEKIFLYKIMRVI